MAGIGSILVVLFISCNYCPLKGAFKILDTQSNLKTSKYKAGACLFMTGNDYVAPLTYHWALSHQ